MTVETAFEVRLPTSLLRLGLGKEEVQGRITEWLVLSLFLENRISSGKAARLLKISRVAFLDLLRARGIAYVDYVPDELAEEFEAVRSLHITPST
jgi:predicted HTH domain antitoxin